MEELDSLKTYILEELLLEYRECEDDCMEDNKTHIDVCINTYAERYHSMKMKTLT